MTATLRSRGSVVKGIDVFAGFGGSSQGIHDSGVDVVAAANHNEHSLVVHSANFPDTEHFQCDLVDPAEPMVVNAKGKKVPGKYLDPADLPAAHFAWFSPSCTHHSQANAKKIYAKGLQLAMWEDEDWDEQDYVNSERSRVTMSCVLRYIDAHHPEIFVVENVLEVTKWGPNRDGSTFRWWLDEVRKAGYDVKPLFLNSMFFAPCPQSRDRVYFVCWRKGNQAPDLDYRPTAFCTSDGCGGRIVQAVQTWKKPTSAWMLETWGKYLAQYDYRCPTCSAPVHPAAWMAASAIAWDDLGPTLEEKIAAGSRPAESTWERIRRAVAKYKNAPPVIVQQTVNQAVQVAVAHADKGGTPHDRARHAGDQIPSVTRSNAIGSAVLVRSGRPRADHPGDALATVVADGSYLGLMVKNHGSIHEAGYRGYHVGESLGAIVGSGRPQSVLALVVPNRTNNVASHIGTPASPVMTSATQALIVAAAGNTYEAPGGSYVRARHHAEPLFTQSATDEFRLVSVPVLRGDHHQDGHAGDALSTVSARGNHLAVVTALFSKINGGAGDTAWHGVDESLNTVTGRDTHGLVVVPWVEHWISDPAHVTEQMATITARLRHTLASIQPSDEPVTDEQLMQVRFRMLQPDPELRRAMAFSPSYILLGNKGQMTAGLGNAVTPPVAAWITDRCLRTLGGGRTNGSARRWAA